MAKGDEGKTSNLTPSWQSGSLNTDPISAEGGNSALRNDIMAGLLKGPAQQSYVGMGQGTKDAFANLQAGAQSNLGLLDSAGGLYRETIQKGGLTDAQMQAMGGLRNLSDQYQGMADTGGLTANQRGAISYLQSVMDGTGTAPGYETLRANAMDDARTAVNQQFGASGRFGAGSHVADLGRGITDAAAGLDYANYQNDLARRAAAASGIFGMENTGIGNVQSALAGKMGAQTGIFNMGQAAQGNMANAASGLSGLYDQYLTPQRISLLGNQAMDADAQGAAAFDPVLNHLANYQGLLSQNAGAPQPEQPFNWRDGAGIGLGLLAAFL